MSTRSRLSHVREFDALALTSLIWFLAKFLRYSFPPLFGTFHEVYQVSNTTLGTAFTALMFTYALMQFPSGALSDKLGAVRVITAGALVAATGALLLIGPVPFAALIGAMLLIGLGTGSHKTVAVPLMSRVYPERTGRALGILDTVGALGGVAAPAVVVILLNISQSHWHILFLGSGLVGISLAALFRYQVPKRVPADAPGNTTENDEAPETAGEEQSDHPVQQYLGMFTDKPFTFFVIATILFAFTFTGTTAFLPLYLTQEAGLTPDTANLLYSSLFAVSLIQIISGDVSDRIGKFPILTATLGLAATALASLLFVSGVVAVGAAVIAFGLGSHGFRPVRGAYLMEIIPDDVAGGTLGIIRTAQTVVGASSPAIVGYLSDTAGFRIGFGLLAGALVVSILLVVLSIVQRTSET